MCSTFSSPANEVFCFSLFIFLNHFWLMFLSLVQCCTSAVIFYVKHLSITLHMYSPTWKDPMREKSAWYSLLGLNCEKLGKLQTIRKRVVELCLIKLQPFHPVRMSHEMFFSLDGGRQLFLKSK